MTENEIPFKYAGFGKRFLAYIIDLVITFIPSFILVFVFGLIVGLAGGNEGLLDVGSRVLGIMIMWIYFALMESSSRQATLGKTAMRIMVIDYEGNRISFARASGRFFAKILSALPFCFGFLMVAFTERKQGLHDLAARCLVVDKKSVTGTPGGGGD